MVHMVESGNNQQQQNRPSSISGIDNDSSGNMGSSNYDNNPGSSNLNGSDSSRKNDDVSCFIKNIEILVEFIYEISF